MLTVSVFVMLGIGLTSFAQQQENTDKKPVSAAEQQQRKERKREKKKLLRQAQEDSKQKLKQLRESAQAAIDEGKRLAERKEFDAAKEQFLRAEGILRGTALKPLAWLDDRIKEHLATLVSQASDLVRQNRLEDAVAVLRNAENVDNRNALVHYDLAVILYKLGKSEEGLHEVDEALSLLPDGMNQSVALEVRSTLIQGSTSEQVDQRTNELAQEFNSFVSKGKIFSRAAFEEQRDGACKRITNLLPQLRENPSVLYNAALCAELKGHYEDARTYYQKYSTAAPMALDLGRIGDRTKYLRGAAYPEARPLPGTCTPIDPPMLLQREILRPPWCAEDAARPDGEFLMAIAEYYNSLGEVDTANTYFNRVLSSDASAENVLAARQAIESSGTRDALYQKYVDDARARLVQLSTAPESGPLRSQELQGILQILDVASSIFPNGRISNELTAYIYLRTGNYHLAFRSLDSLWLQGRPIGLAARVRKTDASQHNKKKAGWRDECVVLTEAKISFTTDLSFCSPLQRPATELEPTRFLDDSIDRTSIRKAYVDESGPLVLLRDDPTQSRYEIDPNISFVTFRINDAEVQGLLILRPHPLDRARGNRMARMLQRYLGIEDVKLGPESFSTKEWAVTGALVAWAGLMIYGNASGSIKIMENLSQEFFFARSAFFMGEAEHAIALLRQFQRPVSPPTSFRLIPLTSIKPEIKTKW